MTVKWQFSGGSDTVPLLIDYFLFDISQQELSKQIDDYTGTYEAEDQMEWNLVLGEIKSFIEADNTINVVDPDSSSIVLSHRLTPLNVPPLEKGTPVYLTLQEVLIVGNCHEQVHLSRYN